jgi:hypothetical protein
MNRIIMHKIIFFLASVIAAVTFASEASAIPAFARQVGMACNACHFQHFPTLNSFGRAFKEGGFTMMGAQEKIEGDGLSIPANLNLAFVTNWEYEKTNGPVNNTDQLTKDYNNGQLEMTQFSLFMGGRVGEHIGFEGEVGLNGGAALASVKTPFANDVGSFKTLIVPFTTDGLGAAQGFEILSTGAVNVHVFNQEDMNAVSAQQFINTATAAHGVALVAASDSGFVNFTKWGLDSVIGNGGESGNNMSGTGLKGAGSPTSNYLRVAWFHDIAGFDSAFGLQYWGGSSASVASGNVVVGTRATAIDAQMLGDLGKMPLTLIASYARAPAASGSDPVNAFNHDFYGQVGTDTRKSLNIGAELGVLPKTTVQLGIRRAKSGIAEGGSTNSSDNAIMLGATYSIAMNVRAEVTYSKYSGDAYNAGTTAMSAASGGLGNQMTAVNLWMGF